MIRVKNFTWNIEVFNLDYGSYNLGCGSKCTAGTKNFKTKGLGSKTFFSVVGKLERKKHHSEHSSTVNRGGFAQGGVKLHRA
jgi:hypothetical protein